MGREIRNDRKRSFSVEDLFAAPLAPAWVLISIESCSRVAPLRHFAWTPMARHAGRAPCTAQPTSTRIPAAAASSTRRPPCAPEHIPANGSSVLSCHKHTLSTPTLSQVLTLGHLPHLCYASARPRLHPNSSYEPSYECFISPSEADPVRHHHHPAPNPGSQPSQACRWVSSVIATTCLGHLPQHMSFQCHSSSQWEKCTRYPSPRFPVLFPFASANRCPPRPVGTCHLSGQLEPVAAQSAFAPTMSGVETGSSAT